MNEAQSKALIEIGQVYGYGRSEISQITADGTAYVFFLNANGKRIHEFHIFADGNRCGWKLTR